MTDLSVIFYTANVIPEFFALAVRSRLMDAIGDKPLISVSHQPMSFGKNIVVDLPRSHFSIYRQALIGAREAKTKYIALCEDDVLYHSTHFDYIPNAGKFAYNMSVWALYTWSMPPVFSYKDRRNLSGLICERLLFIEALEERFAKYPDPDNSLKDTWGEIGKYETLLGVTVRESEEFYSKIPNVAFSHENALSFQGLGKRKKIGHLQAYDIPYWHRAEDVLKLYA